MTATRYPSTAHENADREARQQAIAALDSIAKDAGILKRRLANGSYTDTSDATSLADEAGKVARYLAVLDTLERVRGWNEAEGGAVKLWMLTEILGESGEAAALVWADDPDEARGALRKKSGKHARYCTEIQPERGVAALITVRAQTN